MKLQTPLWRYRLWQLICCSSLHILRINWKDARALETFLLTLQEYRKSKQQSDHKEATSE